METRQTVIEEIISTNKAVIDKIISMRPELNELLNSLDHAID